MLRRFINEARFTLCIETAGPLLVKKDTDKTSEKGQRGALPDAIPMSTTGPDGREYYYIPGSSLKGVMRSHLEKIIRTLRHEDAQTAPIVSAAGTAADQGGQTSSSSSPPRNRRSPSIVCDPFVSAPDGVSTFADVSCGHKFAARYKAASGDLLAEEEPFISPTTAYAESCPVCRLFGSTACAGRVIFDDAYGAVAKSSGTTEVRDFVGIDRLTGGPAGKFKFEVVSRNITFAAHVLVRNFECWQLGALLLVLDDLAAGFVRIGSGRSRGLGAVGGGLAPAGIAIHTIRMPQEEKSDNNVRGIGRVLGNDSPYGTFPDDVLTTMLTPERTFQGIRTVDTYADAVLDDLRIQAIADFIARIDGWIVPESMAKEPSGSPTLSPLSEGVPLRLEERSQEDGTR